MFIPVPIKHRFLLFVCVFEMQHFFYSLNQTLVNDIFYRILCTILQREILPQETQNRPVLHFYDLSICSTKCHVRLTVPC